MICALAAQTACAGLLSGGPGAAQWNATPSRAGFSFNLFTPEQDVELGRLSVQELEQQLPLLRDERVAGYVGRLGERLAANAPGYSFPYQFAVVASGEVNAFALPGGFIFVNAGAIEASESEGELAGVLAHEIAHVALRHGTNQASKAYVAKTGRSVLDAITGGGEFGRLLNSVGGAGAHMLFLKFSRAAETEADLEGARLMAAAGYDPRDMARIFHKLGERSGDRRHEAASDHPAPASRIAAINKSLPSLSLSREPIRDTREFHRMRARLAGKRGWK